MEQRMAVITLIEVSGATPEDYDKINDRIGTNDAANHPAGLRSHTAAILDGGMLIIDVWDDPSGLASFFETSDVQGAMQDLGVTPGAPRIVPVHNRIPRGAGTSPGVVMMFESDDLTPAKYDAMISHMPAHVLDGSRHPAVSHVLGATDAGGVIAIDVWESPQAFARFAEEQIGPAAEAAGIGPIEPRFYPVHNHVTADAPIGARTA
jgi:hypothetical protein